VTQNNGKAARKSRTVTASTLAAEYGTTKHGTADADGTVSGQRYGVMMRRTDKANNVYWQHITPRLNGGRVELMSRTGVIARLAPTEKVTISDEVRDGDVSVSWHLLKAVNTLTAVRCAAPHLRGYGSDGTSYCQARKAATGKATKGAALAAEAAALAEAEAAKVKRADAARKAAATRKASKAAKRDAAPATVAADTADAVVAALIDSAVA